MNAQTTLAARDTADLIDAAKAGDPDALSDLYRLYRSSVYGYVLNRVCHCALAEDLTSEVFVRVVCRIGAFKGNSTAAFTSWLFTIARNLIIDHYRSHRVRLEIPSGQMLDYDIADVRSEDALNAVATLPTLLVAVSRLRPKQRDCILLRLLLDWSLIATSVAMGCGIATTKSRQLRGVRALAGDPQVRDLMEPAVVS